MIIKKWILFSMFSIISIIFLNWSPGSVLAADSPYDVPSSVKNNWDEIYGDKEKLMESGKNLTYDVYYDKYTDGGYKIKSKDFGDGKKDYINFQGWAINFGYANHYTDNNETYIVAQDVKDTSKKKVYKTLSKGNLNPTTEVSYNYVSNGMQLWNPCSDSARNKSNTECNMYYKDVGFDAYLPYDELFPDKGEERKWRLYLVKKVHSHIVYTELKLPFEFDPIQYGTGEITMSSGINARNLFMNSWPVIRQSAPGSGETGKYFDKGARYKAVAQNENYGVAIWFGVITPEDGGKTKWSSSPYWTFGGEQAILHYVPKIQPGVTILTSALICLDSEIQAKVSVLTGKGETKQLNGNNSALKWESSNSSVVKVSAAGVMKALKKGTAKIKVTYTDSTTGEKYDNTLTVVVDDSCFSDQPELGMCKNIIEDPKIVTTKDKNTNVNPSGNISAEGVFDVTEGIPTSEDLKDEATTEEYLFNQLWNKKQGDVIYTIEVSKGYELKWNVKVDTVEGGEQTTGSVPMSTTVYKKYVYEIPRLYKYWDIGKLEIYWLNQVELKNYAFDTENDILKYGAELDYSVDHKLPVASHVEKANCAPVELGVKVVNGGDKMPEVPDEEDALKSKADAAIGQNKVRNDKVIFKDETIMNDEWVEKETPTPSDIPNSKKVTLDHRNITISNSKRNYYKAPSSGSVLYDRIENIYGTGENQYEKGFGVNVVTIHTPIVLKGDTSDEVDYDQRIDRTPHKTKHVLILDRVFRVDLSATGSHRSIPGYGTRDYTKYIDYKEVKFPFDVYDEKKSKFYPKETWIRLAGTQTSANFFLPIWVPENQYKIHYREFAINSPTSNYGTEEQKNVTIPNSAFNISPAGTRSAAHVVTDEINIDVIGRVYDFKVTDVSDYNWKDVFRTGNGNEHTGNQFWVGTKNRDGLERGNPAEITLPIAPGRHTKGYKNVAVKTGYHFKFDLKTMGNMFAKDDAIRIVPKFYFVGKDGQNRREVDVYYHDKTNYFVKVGSDNDKTYREVVLNNPLRNLPIDQLKLTGDYYYRHAEEFNFKENPSDMFYATFIRNYINKISKEDTVTGPYGWQILNWNLRNYIGPRVETVPTNTMIPSKDTIRSEQQWYAEYSLPAKVYVVDKGKDIAGAGVLNRLNESHPMFLKDGYIIVNFDIETIQNGDLDKPYLKYVNGEVSNEWKREGFNYNYVDGYSNNFKLIDGDVLFYHGNKSSNDDFKASVTH
ncbi:DUF5704 domain-containing protein [Viridibacillus arvi]|uniref:DUF5704 domain-containing protein n=1 Tax=Viridibacillus arvi TaxID=263475 RepID=UPI0034CD8076